MIQGWTIQIHETLRKQDPAALDWALVLLTSHLKTICKLVPTKPLTELKKITIWLSPEYPNTPPRAEYHPGADWLRSNGRNPEMAKGVEITDVKHFDAETRRMPLFVLHELAHGYHDRVLGNDEPRLLAAYKSAKAGGKYDRVERQDSEGRKRLDRHYGLSSVQEYFAEGTEAFFGANDFYPFNKAQLKTHDLELFALLGKIWQK
ncbi:hypothetical protein [Armatimonas sp.]|uniref:hypothetical protein n=1 Tax=Armatimonas sp. TaxID=1872638 RepID=UPI00286C99EF|nr:hypothetical protein [Armatimonas sp.]